MENYVTKSNFNENMHFKTLYSCFFQAKSEIFFFIQISKIEYVVPLETESNKKCEGKGFLDIFNSK